MTMPMDDEDYFTQHVDNNTMVDVKLFKAIGLYQLLEPVERSGFSQRFRTAYLTVLWVTTGLLIMQSVRLYLTLGNLQTFVYSAMLITVGLNCIIKGYVMVTNANRLRSVLDVALYGFTLCGCRDQVEFNRYRDFLFTRLRVYAIFNFVTLIIWLSVPFFINEYMSFTKMDGTVGHYRQTILNFWIPVSENTYNWIPVWTLIYTIESVISSMYIFSFILFDCYLITACMALSAQFRTLSAAYETLGPSSLKSFPYHSSKILKTTRVN